MRDLEKTLDRARRLWMAGQHNDKRYPASYFIEWAKSKGISVSGDIERAVEDRDQTGKESADKKRIRFADMKKSSGKSDAELANEVGITRARFQQIRSEGDAILAEQAKKASSFAGQLMPEGVAGKKRKK